MQLKARLARVDANRKRKVPADFDAVAKAYDRMVTRNPGYLDHLRLSADRLAIGPDRPVDVLDLCCGTGLSTAALRAAYPSARLWGVDASAEMLALARRKPDLSDVTFVLGDAMDPAAALRDAGAPARYDAVFMAYGIRNVPDADACLASVRRLLVRGAPLCIHEYSVNDSVRAKATWTAVAWTIIIPSGLITHRHTRVYRYLWRSVLSFDGAAAFEQRLARAGFDDVRREPVSGWQRDIVHSFLARAPRRETDAGPSA